jgi:hypothetical protein
VGSDSETIAFTMSPWFEIALIVFLAMIVIALIGIRDDVESTGRRMKKVIERLLSGSQWR